MNNEEIEQLRLCAKAVNAGLFWNYESAFITFRDGETHKFDEDCLLALIDWLILDHEVIFQILPYSVIASHIDRGKTEVQKEEIMVGYEFPYRQMKVGPVLLKAAIHVGAAIGRELA